MTPRSELGSMVPSPVRLPPHRRREVTTHDVDLRGIASSNEMDTLDVTSAPVMTEPTAAAASIETTPYAELSNELHALVVALVAPHTQWSARTSPLPPLERTVIEKIDALERRQRSGGRRAPGPGSMSSAA